MPAIGTPQISRLTWSLEVGGLDVDPIQGAVTWDETSIPSLQIDVVIPYSDATWTAVDPQADARAQLSALHEFTESDPLATITAEGHTTLADLSAAWSGLTLADVSALYGTPITPDGTLYPHDRLAFDVGVRTARRTRSDGQEFVTLTLACDEARALDVLATERLELASTTIRGLINEALGYIDATLEPDLDNPDSSSPFHTDGPLPDGANLWEVGVSVWDVIKAAADSGGYIIRCDHQSKWRLVDPGFTATPSAGEPVNTSYVDAAQISHDRSREDDWYDTVVIEYRWRDESGVEQQQTDVATIAVGTPRRVYHEVRSAPYGGSAAAAILERVSNRGNHVEGSQAVNLWARPGSVLNWEVDPGELDAGIVSRVRWSITDDVMALQGRDF